MYPLASPRTEAPQPLSGPHPAGGSSAFGTNAACDSPLPWPCAIPGVPGDLEVKIASSPAEWEEAFALLAVAYQARGYQDRDDGLRFTPHHALPDTATLVARSQVRVLATLAVVFDSFPLGLPMESVYPEEIAALRGQGRRLGESTCLAMAGIRAREVASIFLALGRLMTQYFLSRGGEVMLICVNPRHRRFYCDQLGFVPFGPRRAYPAVQDHPAEAFLLDVPLMRANAPEAYRRIVADQVPPQALAAPSLPHHLAGLYAERSSRCDRSAVGQVLRLARNGARLRRWD